MVYGYPVDPIRGATPLKPIEPIITPQLLHAAEELLARVKSGETTSLAIVEVTRGAAVRFERVNVNQFHALHSGVASLANMLGSERD